MIMATDPTTDTLLQSERGAFTVIQSIREWAIFMLNPLGEIVSWNPGAERIYGYKAEEIIGRDWRILYPDVEQKSHRPQLDLQAAARQARLEGGGWHAKSDGSTYWVNVVIARVLDDRGHVAGFGVITKDSTARRSEALSYRMMVEGVMDYAIFSLDPTGIVTSWNRGAERIKGYQEEEIVGRHFSRFYTSSDIRQGLPEKVLKLAADQGHYEGEGWRVRKDGSLFWSNVVVTALRDEGGRLIGFSKITRDMTERKMLLDRIQRHTDELELRIRERDQTNADLEAFSYSVSHDLKAPVRAIDGFADALKEEAWDKLNETERGHLAEITAASGRMSVLIQDLLDYSHIGRGALELKRVNLRESIHEALRDVFTETPILVSVGSGLEVLANGPLLVRAISNLAGNAVKFHKPGAHPIVKISAVVRGHAVRISVTDNGIGIAPEHRHRIFEVFQRLHTESEYPGTGIGLALVKRAIVRMGGSNGVESRVGQGSTFWIELPAADNPRLQSLRPEGLTKKGGPQ
jgi:PAS domain S-box-containing protein